MNTTIIYAVKSGISWLVAGSSVVGYVLTLKRTGEKWWLWALLAIGWTFLAIANTLVLGGLVAGRSQLLVLWLSSFVLVSASLLLLFLKVTGLMRRRVEASLRQR